MVNDDHPVERRARRLTALAAAAVLAAAGTAAGASPASASPAPASPGLSSPWPTAPTLPGAFSPWPLVAVPGRSSASNPASNPAASPASALQRSVDAAVAAGAVGYVARVDDGNSVTKAVAGLADRDDGRRLRTGDEFEIGSNTKTFMAVLTLQLVADRELKLSDPVEKYLPGVVPNGEHITVRMLLNHTSGLFNYTADPEFARTLLADPTTGWKPEELVAMATSHRPNFAPGKGWSYSNTNYVLVGMLLEAVTGTSPARLVERRIAEPLGLEHTFLVDSSAEDTGEGYAHGYLVAFGAAGTAPRYTDVSDWNLGSWASTAGAMISTPAELSRFFSALLGGELLPPTQLAQMRTTVPLPKGFALSGGYGLGLMRLNTPCGVVWGHGGDTLGHHSTALFSPDGRRTAVADATTQLDPRVRPTDRAGVWARAVSTADATAVCAMYGKALPSAGREAA